ncbi:hypothetical protein RJ641_013795, partial [Dillenia turbinata]
MLSSQGFLGEGLTLRRACQTALLHLNPLPKAICHIRSSLLTFILASIYASSYHIELEELQVLLKLIYHGSTACMNAKVMECKLEIRYIRLDLRIKQLPPNQDLSAPPATASKSLDRETPVFPSSSCSWYTHLNALSSAPQCVLTICKSLYLALCLSEDLLDSKTTEQPTRNKQLVINMDFLLPKYPFWVMFSVLTTIAY